MELLEIEYRKPKRTSDLLFPCSAKQLAETLRNHSDVITLRRVLSEFAPFHDDSMDYAIDRACQLASCEIGPPDKATKTIHDFDWARWYLLKKITMAQLLAWTRTHERLHHS